MIKKSVILITLLLAAFTSAQANEEDNAIYKNHFMKQGLSMVTSSLQDNMKNLSLPNDPSCPQPGMMVHENLNQSRGKIFSAVNDVHDLMETIKPQVHSLRESVNQCGSCRQTNLVSYFASINPEKIQPVEECARRPSETFQRDLQSKSEIKDFIEDILKGQNSDGQRLNQACPDPCAFYVTTAETSLPNGKTHLTLTVQCGHPRQDSILSAKYEYKAGIVHQWTCSK